MAETQVWSPTNQTNVEQGRKKKTGLHSNCAVALILVGCVHKVSSFLETTVRFPEPDVKRALTIPNLLFFWSPVRGVVCCEGGGLLGGCPVVRGGGGVVRGVVCCEGGGLLGGGGLL